MVGNSKSKGDGLVYLLYYLCLLVGDDLQTVANTNIPLGRLAFRREVLAEEQRLMMLSRRRSRTNTGDSWYSVETSRPSSWNMPNTASKGLASTMLGLSIADKGLENVDEKSDESENGRA